MLKSVFKYATLFATTITSLSYADCQTTFELGLGYRRDCTTWDLDTVDIFGTEYDSKISFKDQNIVLIDAKARMIEDWFYFRADADYGWIVSGKGTASFRSTPLVGAEFEVSSHSNLKKRNNVADVTAAVGYPFEFSCGDIILAPVVGYAYHWQRYNVRGVFGPLVSDSSSSDDSSRHDHKIRWYGPLIGFDAFWRIDDCWNLYGEFEYVFAQCSRSGGNNTGIVAFDSHNRKNTAHGFDGSVGADYFINCNWYAGLSIDFTYYRTKKTHRRDLPLPGAAISSSFENNLGDQLRWSSVGFNANVGYLF